MECGIGGLVEDTLTGLGVACILGALVGSALKALGQPVPVINTFRRRATLAISGTFLVVAAFVLGSGDLGAGAGPHPISVPARATDLPDPHDVAEEADQAPISEPHTADDSTSRPPVQVSEHPTSTSSLGSGPLRDRSARTGPDFPEASEYYPVAARRLREEGAVVIRACIDVNGMLTEPPALVSPSGSERIDAGALEMATAGTGHYLPEIKNGVPVKSCFNYRVNFSLR